MTRRVAVVSGASRGIGAAIICELAQAGYLTVGLHARHSDSSMAVEDRLRAADPGNSLVVCDTTDRAQVAETFARIARTAGVVTDLVNCAGVTRDGPLALMTDEKWDDVVDTNLTGTYNVTKQFVYPAMRNGFGVVTNISSISGLHGNPGQVNYAATKAGLDGFTRSLAKEVGRSGVRVNSVAPGFIDTDMTAGLGETQRKRLASSISLRRLGVPGDVASVVAFLHSAGAGYITGQTIVVDGGTQL
ncbi:3-oxoacyl-ACP reductase FabG [Nocardia crassostreae]|uniref:3-oxoacyl-ACP reductase FabG n=1 Tax=Nocardia crassostreae TaxID=53428 RepID=UPI000832FD43|nr:3-oxoacyl-ACP reductase FabG [Nocardia crassostreae]